MRFLRVVMLVIFVASVLLLLALDASLVTIAGVVITILMGGTTYIAWYFRRMMNAMLGGPDPMTRRSVDVSAEERPTPRVLDHIRVVLSRFDFRRLGESALVNAADKELATSWNFISADGRVAATLVPSRGVWGGMLMEFSSVFPDETWAHTLFPSGFPHGETFDGPDLYCHHVQTTPQAAYQHHRDLIAQLAQTHGAPRVIASMAEYLAAEKKVRSKHGPLKQRRMTMLNDLQLRLPASLMVVTLLATLASAALPTVAVLVFMTAYAIYMVFTMLLLSVHPSTKKRMVMIVAVMWALFVPLTVIAPWTALIFVFVLALLIIISVRMLPADARAFAKEIEKQKEHVDWQGLAS